MDRVFLGFPPLPKVLERIGQLDDPQFDLLRAEVQGADAFSVADSRVSRLAEALPSSNETEVFDLIQALDFLYDRCREWEAGDDERDFRGPLRGFLKTTQALAKPWP